MKQTSSRAGTFRNQPSGYAAFIPTPLNPPPSLVWDQELATLLGEAGLGLGRLDGLTRVLPNPDLFVSIFVRQEAVLSSQIEGTQCTLEDVLNFAAQPEKKGKESEVATVINYVEAMNHGLNRLTASDGLPLSMRLLREIHSILMDGVRGQNRDPGEVRRTQNWIGPGGSSLMTASYVPPPVPEMHEALSDFEKFLHVQSDIPPLIQVALAHAQFETIHPFLDGNGRLGRLLITLFLCERKLLKRPMLYLSHFLKSNQYEYYNRLTAIREDGAWEEWLKFFLRGVRIVSAQAVRNAELLIELRETHKQEISRKINSPNAFTLLDYLCDQPIITVQMAADHLQCSYITAQRLIEEFEQMQLLKETTGQKRNKRFEYEPYVRFWKTAQDDYVGIQSSIADTPAEAISSKKTMELTVAWLTNAKKLVFLHDNNSNEVVGITVMHNNELRELLYALGESASLDFDKLDLQPIPVKSNPPALQTLIGKTLTDREYELAGKEAITEAFYLVKNILGRKIDDTAISWEDNSDGSALVFYSNDVRIGVQLSLQEIKNYALNSLVRDSVREKMAIELKRVPVYMAAPDMANKASLKNVPASVKSAIRRLKETWDREDFIEREVQINGGPDFSQEWIFRYKLEKASGGVYKFELVFPRPEGGKYWYKVIGENADWHYFSADIDRVVEEFISKWNDAQVPRF